MHTLLKTSVRFPLFAAAVAIALPCFAQVSNPPRAVVSIDAAPCTTSPAAPGFVALSVATKASFPSTPTSLFGGVAQRLSFDDIGVTRAVDDCSVALYSLLFRDQHIKLVTISFQNFVNGAYKDMLIMSLREALITSIADTESINLAPAERISFSFASITIFDPVTGKSSSFDQQTLKGT